MARLAALWGDDELTALRDTFANRQSQVYAILSPGDPSAVKIGISDAPEKRFSAIQSSNPVSLQLLGYIPGDRDIESRLHAYLDAYKIRGEWFEYVGRSRKIAEAVSKFDLLYIYKCLMDNDL